MKIEINESNTVKVLRLEGALNSKTARETETRLNQLIMGGNNKLVVSLEEINYIASAGLRVFLMANKLIKKQKGELALCCLNNTVKEVFEISGFNLIFKIFDTEEEALTHFWGHGGYNK